MDKRHIAPDATQTLKLASRYAIETNAGFASDEMSIFVDRERPADTIALPIITAFLHKKLTLGFGLNAFGKNRNIEAMTERDDGPHNRL